MRNLVLTHGNLPVLVTRDRPMVLIVGGSDQASQLTAYPGGPYWRNRDLGAWSIPKGELGEAEDAESAARGEFK